MVVLANVRLGWRECASESSGILLSSVTAPWVNSYPAKHNDGFRFNRPSVQIQVGAGRQAINVLHRGIGGINNTLNNKRQPRNHWCSFPLERERLRADFQRESRFWGALD